MMAERDCSQGHSRGQQDSRDAQEESMNVGSDMDVGSDDSGTDPDMPPLIDDNDNLDNRPLSSLTALIDISRTLGALFRGMHRECDVVEIRSGSQAEELGITPGWIARRVNGQPVGTPGEFVDAVLLLRCQGFREAVVRFDIPPQAAVAQHSHRLGTLTWHRQMISTTWHEELHACLAQQANRDGTGSGVWNVALQMEEVD
jgi:hypothetical protein